MLRQVSTMSKLTELLDELCPDGVEYRPVGEVAELQRGTSITKKKVVAGDVPVVAGGRQPAYFHNEANREGETIVVAGSGAYAGYVSWWDRPIFVSDAFSIKSADSELSNRFCYYWLNSIQELLHQSKSGGGVPHVYAKDVARLKMPVPPLEVQQEIVRVLDAFTDLEQSLVSELELRKKQLAVLHEGLLEEVADQSELLSLESVCSQILAGGDKPKDCVKSQTSPTEERPFPVFSNGTGRDSLYGYSSECRVNAEAVTIAARGSVGHHAVRAAGFTPIIRLITLIPNSEVISAKYLNCALDTLSIDGTSGGISQLTVPMVKKLSIPVPSLEDQAAVVAKLDSLEALIGSIEQEISLRRQQYEFYRDELLSFAPEED